MALLKRSPPFRLFQSRAISKEAEYCVQSVRRHDRENFTASLLLGSALTAPAIAVRAFNVELSRVRDQTADPKIAAVRFQFWTDALDKIFSQETKIPAHPVVTELCKVCRKFQLSKRNLVRLVASRRDNFSKKYYVSLDEMEKYAEESVSPVYYSLLQAAGIKNVHADHAASHLGKAQGLTNMLRSVSVAAQSRVVLLPQDLLMKHNFSQEDVLRLTVNQSFKDVIFDVATRANQHIEKARSIETPSECKKILLPAVAVDSYLKKLQKYDFSLHDKHLNAANSLLPLQLYWNKLKSKY